MANREGSMFCATNWFGFANADVPNAVLALSDLSYSRSWPTGDSRENSTSSTYRGS